MVTYEQIALFMEMVAFGAILYAFREKLSRGMYGVRHKRWQEIDTGRRGYVVLDKAMNSCTINNTKKSVNRANITGGIIYFVSTLAENVKLEDCKEKYSFYMNSEEFDTVYKNKLLQNLMLSLQSNFLMIIVILVILAIMIGAYNAYTMYQMTPKVEFIVWAVNQSVIR